MSTSPPISRDTERTSGAIVSENTETVAIDNCITTTATDEGADPQSASAQSCAPLQILPAETGGPPIIFLDADPTGSISVDKTNTADGSPPSDTGTAEPGDSFTFHFQVDCSNPIEDCVDYTFTDTFPPEVEVDESTLPESIPGFREVTFDEATNTLTVRYIGRLDNPAGTGLPAGGGDTFDVTVTLPADTPLPDGFEIVNEATVEADNVAEEATDETTVVVSIPRVVEVGDDASRSPRVRSISTDPEAAPVISLSGTNNSSSHGRGQRDGVRGLHGRRRGTTSTSRR